MDDCKLSTDLNAKVYYKGISEESLGLRGSPIGRREVKGQGRAVKDD